MTRELDQWRQLVFAGGVAAKGRLHCRVFPRGRGAAAQTGVCSGTTML